MVHTLTFATTLDCFQVTSWSWPSANGKLAITADGELTISAWDPQEEITVELQGVTCEIEIDNLSDMPTTAAEITELLGPNPEWLVTDGDD